MSEQNFESESGSAGTSSQLAFKWKSGYAETFQAGHMAWKDTAPQGKQSAQDYIIALIQEHHARLTESGIAAKAESLEINNLLDAFNRRKAADEHMINVIMDTVGAANERAKLLVKLEMETLQTQNATMLTQFNALQSDKAGLTDSLKNAQDSLQRAEKTISDQLCQIASLEQNIGETKASFVLVNEKNAELESVLSQIKSELDIARREVLDFKEERLALETAKSELGQALANAKLEHEKANLALETEIAKLRTEFDKQGNELAKTQADKAELLDKLAMLETKLETLSNEKSELLQNTAAMQARLEEKEKTAADMRSVINAFKQKDRKQRESKAQKQTASVETQTNITE